MSELPWTGVSFHYFISFVPFGSYEVWQGKDTAEKKQPIHLKTDIKWNALLLVKHSDDALTAATAATVFVYLFRSCLAIWAPETSTTSRTLRWCMCMAASGETCFMRALNRTPRYLRKPYLLQEFGSVGHVWRRVLLLHYILVSGASLNINIISIILSTF